MKTTMKSRIALVLVMAFMAVTLNAGFASATEDNNGVKTLIDSLTQVVETVKSDVLGLKESTQATNAELEAMKQELATLKQTTQTLTEANATLTKEVSDIRNALPKQQQWEITVSGANSNALPQQYYTFTLKNSKNEIVYQDSEYNSSASMAGLSIKLPNITETYRLHVDGFKFNDGSDWKEVQTKTEIQSSNHSARLLINVR